MKAVAISRRCQQRRVVVQPETFPKPVDSAVLHGWRGPGGMQPGKGEMGLLLGRKKMPRLVNVTHKISGSSRDGPIWCLVIKPGREMGLGLLVCTGEGWVR